MPLELFIYFLLPGDAEGSACSACGPLAGPRSQVSLPCSSCGTPPRCPPCRRWGRRRRSISRSPHSLGKGALGIYRGLRRIQGEQAKKVRGMGHTQAHFPFWTDTHGYQTGKRRDGCSGDDSCVNVITIGRQTKHKWFCRTSLLSREPARLLF